MLFTHFVVSFILLANIFFAITWASGLVMVWHSRNGAGCINKVTLMTGPISTWMGDHLWTDKTPQYVTSHPSQLGLLPSAGLEMSTDQSAVMLCGRGVKEGAAHLICGCTRGWQVKLRDPSLTCAISERLRGESDSV